MSRVFNITKTFRRLTTKNDFVLPERFKGTFLEKWANYWKSLFIDYKSMITDLKVEMQEKPRKALVTTSGIIVLWQLAMNNPNENDYKECLRRYTNQLILVGEPCQNRNTTSHFKSIENSINENTLRRLNLGFVSFLWIDDYDENCGVYKAKCDYLRPKYTSIPGRIVDIGFAGKWWNIYRKFHNFDVNL